MAKRTFEIDPWPGGHHVITVKVDDFEDEAAALVQAVIDHGDSALGGGESSGHGVVFNVWVREVKS